MSTPSVWHATLNAGDHITRERKRKLLIKQVETGKKEILQVFQMFQNRYGWNWNQVTEDRSLLGRAIGGNRIEVVTYPLQIISIDKSKCGIRKFGNCYMNPVMQCLLMAETRDTRRMLIKILRAGTKVNVNFVRKDGVSCLQQALTLKHPEYPKQT